MAPSLTVNPLDYGQHKRLHHCLKTDKGLTVDIEIEDDKLKEEYFDRYDSIHTEIYCKILLDTGVSRSYISKTYYMGCNSLHTLLKFASTTQRAQIGKGQYVELLFVIPVVIDEYGHKFEVFTLV